MIVNEVKWWRCDDDVGWWWWFLEFVDLKAKGMVWTMPYVYAINDPTP
jgi:hypothetical protein